MRQLENLNRAKLLLEQSINSIEQKNIHELITILQNNVINNLSILPSAIEKEILEIICNEFNDISPKEFSFEVLDFGYCNSLEIKLNNESFGFIDFKTKSLHFYISFRRMIENHNLLYFVNNTVYLINEEIKKLNHKISFYNKYKIFKFLQYSKYKKYYTDLKNKKEQLLKVEEEKVSYTKKIEEISSKINEYDKIIDFLKLYNISPPYDIKDESLLKCYRFYGEKTNNLTQFNHVLFDSIFDYNMGRCLFTKNDIELPYNSVDYMEKLIITPSKFVDILDSIKTLRGKFIWIESPLYYGIKEEEFNRKTKQLIKQMNEEYDFSLLYSLQDLEISSISFELNGCFITIDSLGTIYSDEKGLSLIKKHMIIK